MQPDPSEGSIKMMAVLEEWEDGTGCHVDNTVKYLLLVLFKLGLDATVFFLFCHRLYTSFLTMCSLSIILADSVMVFFLGMVWFLGAERSPVSTCFLLAHASSTYAALPLPMMSVGLLDYCSQDAYICKQSTFCKYVRNALLLLLIWALAVTFSFGSVNAEAMELQNIKQVKALVCEVQESTPITCFVVVVFMAVICAMLPFWSSIPRWLREADRLSETREERANQTSDFLFVSKNNCTVETKGSEKTHPEESDLPRPPLWLSLMLGFAVFWTPYLAISVTCLFFDIGVPAYITVNILWMECANSFLMGVVFWAKSSTLGPYSRLPENVCLWHVYWHLSKGTRQPQLPIMVINPSKVKRTSLFYV